MSNGKTSLVTLRSINASKVIINARTALTLSLSISLLQKEKRSLKRNVYNTVIVNLFFLKEVGVDLIIQIIEEWGYSYIKKAIRECYSNVYQLKTVIESNEATMCLLFNSLIKHKNKVSLIN